MKKMFLTFACITFGTCAFAANDVSNVKLSISEPVEVDETVKEWPTRIDCSVTTFDADGNAYTFSASAWGWNANDAGANCSAKLEAAQEDRD